MHSYKKQISFQEYIVTGRKSINYLLNQGTSMTKALTNVDSQDVVSQEEIRMTPFVLAQYLSQNPKLELSGDKKLVIHNIDSADFLDIAKHTEANQRLLILGQMMNRYSVELALEGSIALGGLNLNDYSWTLSAGASGSLSIAGKVAALRRSLSDMVSFLHMLPKTQGFVLKPFQDLFLTGLSADALLEYYKFSQANTEAQPREKQQEQLFVAECQLLADKKQTLKIFGLNATQIDRFIDVNAGGILFKAVGTNEQSPAALVLGLAPFKAPK